MRVLTVTVLLMGVAGMGSAVAKSPAARTVFDEAQAEQRCQKWREAIKRGQPSSAVRADRILFVGQPKTTAYMPGRRTLEVDERGRVIGASCD